MIHKTVWKRVVGLFHLAPKPFTRKPVGDIFLTEQHAMGVLVLLPSPQSPYLSSHTYGCVPYLLYSKHVKCSSRDPIQGALFRRALSRFWPPDWSRKLMNISGRVLTSSDHDLQPAIQLALPFQTCRNQSDCNYIWQASLDSLVPTATSKPHDLPGKGRDLRNQAVLIRSGAHLEG